MKIYIVKGISNVCDYGCGQEAKYQFKNGKWCCSKSYNSCPELRRKNSEVNKGKKRSKKTRKKISEANSGEKNSMYGRNHSKETKKKIGEANKGLTIEQIKERNPFFSQIEEMRCNPNNPGEKEIQVHCKNHLCKNSREKGGWFTSTRRQLFERINTVENPRGFGESNFYCSQKCKDICILYNVYSDPFKNTKLLYTPIEYNIFIVEVLRRQREEHKYNFCEICYSIENLHVHHEKPVKTHPHLALDPDNGIVLCKNCHYKYGHKTGTECSTGNLANKICN